MAKKDDAAKAADDKNKADDPAKAERRPTQNERAKDEEARARDEQRGGDRATDANQPPDMGDPAVVNAARAGLTAPDHPLVDEMDPEALERAARQGRVQEVLDEEQRVTDKRNGVPTAEEQAEADEKRKAACFEVKNWSDEAGESLGDDRILHRDVDERTHEGRVFVRLDDSFAGGRQAEMEQLKSHLVGRAVVVERYYLVEHPHEV